MNTVHEQFNTSNNQIEHWEWKMIWKVEIPNKVASPLTSSKKKKKTCACFIWLLAREAVLTQDNLCRRGYQLCSRCYRYGSVPETISHLFLHCKLTTQLWRMFISLGYWLEPQVHSGSSSTLKQRRYQPNPKGEMKGCPSLHMVDNRCFEGKVYQKEKLVSQLDRSPSSPKSWVEVTNSINQVKNVFSIVPNF